MKKTNILMGLNLFILNMFEVSAGAKIKRDIIINNRNQTNKQKKASIDILLAMKKSKGVAKSSALYNIEMKKMQDIEVEFKGILADKTLSQEGQQSKLEALSQKFQEQKEKCDSLRSKLSEIMEECRAKFIKNKLNLYYKVVSIGASAPNFYNEQYLKEKFDDLTDEFVEELDKALKTFGTN